MGWYEALKDLLTVADRVRDAELKQSLATVQVECAKLAEENARLRQELVDLRERAEIRRTMTYAGNVYWREVDGHREGPFCPKCLDGDNKAARMAERADDRYWRCAVCAYSSEIPGQAPRQTRAITRFDPRES
jgi:hypothetical protein